MLVISKKHGQIYEKEVKIMGTMEISKNAENTKADVMKLIKSNPEKTVSMKKRRQRERM